jgi:hypothetical protein
MIGGGVESGLWALKRSQLAGDGKLLTPTVE